MEKKKILIFSLAYHPFVGGAEVAIKEITDRLGEGFDFDMITVNLDGKQLKEEKIGNINVFRIGRGKLSKYFFPWTALRKAEELNKKNNYYLIWAMMANQAGWAAMKFKRKFPRTKYLLTLQEGDSEGDIWLRTWFMRGIYKSIYRQADCIQAISGFLAERAKKMGIRCPIEIVPNAVKIKNFIENKSNDLKRVITVSRLVKKNGLEYLIDAIKLVNDSYNKPVILKIIGDGKLRNKLEAMIKKLKINNRTIIKESEKKERVLEGEVVNEQVYEYLRQADVFVRPSLSEGLGSAFLEAMACNVPVIATPVGGIPDFLRDGETGWFCEVKNPESIAEKIKYILDEKNKDEVLRVGKNAKKMVEEKYNWELISKKIGDIFNQVL